MRDYKILVVDREPRGERMRVLPGVMGEVLAVNGDSSTVVRCKVSDLERAIAKLPESDRAFVRSHLGLEEVSPNGE